MDPLRVLTADEGFFTTAEARSAGYGERAISRMVRDGVWVRFRRGTYAFTDEWRALDTVGRHRVRSNAIMRSHNGHVALSHQSGVIRHRLDSWGLNLDRVHVTRLDGGPGRIEHDVVHHEGFVADADLVVVENQLALSAVRCVLEAGSRAGNEVALSLFDAGLRGGAYTDRQLVEQFELMEHWPFVRHLHVPVRMADPRAASVGESRGRWWFSRLGIPAPALQHEVRDSDGSLIGITDWWWEEHGVMGEFDGRVKYGRLLKPGQDPGDAVFEEKRREDQLRERTGSSMLRLTWDDLNHPTDIRTRFDSLARRIG
ncbi:MAG: type IV toxin-antitoxin system AbiEi family antitoxin domain-containing protein [Nocardioidaceae bacterium]|nr:type IV toxin-antitoxin system AbiEi family antitoxin domain-containing protein [Nocardioidaceae bacterium]MCL2611913.1 type IV toxin-antitoxin system AbiEi family antitoxin domain-containing protein [Nocardioidaceae bacterium]